VPSDTNALHMADGSPPTTPGELAHEPPRPAESAQTTTPGIATDHLPDEVTLELLKQADHLDQSDPGGHHRIVFDPWAARPTLGLMTLVSKSPADETPAGPAPQLRRARSQKTEDQYRDRVRSLYRQSSALRTLDSQNPVEPTPAEVTQDLIDSASEGPNGERPVRAKNSWALYRAALLWHLAGKRQVNEAYEAAYQKLARCKKPAGSRRAPAPAKKTFVGDDFAKIINTLGQLNTRRSFWGSFTAFWLQAGVACGARPGEWVETSWLDRDKLQLLILNTKRKHSVPAFTKTAGLPDRTVHDVDALEDDDEDDDGDNEAGAVDAATHRIVRVDRNDAVYVDMHMATLERHIRRLVGKQVSPEIAFRRYHDMARRTLRMACDIAFKGERYYTLRTTRSQFSADRKVTHELGAVAAMMGQSNTRTCMQHYGSRRAGLKGRRAQGDFLTQTLIESLQPSAPNQSPLAFDPGANTHI